jgi:hypothetical protein
MPSRKPILPADVAAFVRGEDMPVRPAEVAPPAPVATEPEARVRFTVDLPRSLHKRLKLAAVDRDIPMTDLAREVFTEWLSSQG